MPHPEEAEPSIHRGFTMAAGFAGWCFLGAVLVLVVSQILHRRPVIIHHASILTMDADSELAEAVLWRNGTIELVGDNETVLAQRRWYTSVRDMTGLVVIPGFVDAHSHFPASGVQAITLDLSAPPLGVIDSLEKLYTRIGEHIDSLEKGEWLLGFNYDHASLQEGQHPQREVLDELAPERPVYLYHSSGHMGVANSAALDALAEKPDNAARPHAQPDAQTDAQTDAKPGEQPRQLKPASGLLQESDAPALSVLLSKLGLGANATAFFTARDEYARQGVTTVMNGATGSALLKTLWLVSGTPLMSLRTLVSPRSDILLGESDAPLSYSQVRASYQSRHFFIGPAKFTIDGSPQGYTAFLGQPYVVQPQERQADPGWRGRALVSEKQLTAQATILNNAGWQLALHGNGDAAIDVVLDSLANTGFTREDARRPVIVHAQTARQDQILRMQALGATPSFFIAHVFYWGEWHRERILGRLRAENISPTVWASSAGLRFTLHSDAPVTPMRPFDLLQQAVNRTTFQGRTLGEDQRLTPSEALRALTIDAAWQYHLEDRIGSITAGKYADFAILNANPLQPSDANAKAKVINVLETIVDGRTVYRSQDR